MKSITLHIPERVTIRGYAITFLPKSFARTQQRQRHLNSLSFTFDCNFVQSPGKWNKIPGMESVCLQCITEYLTILPAKMLSLLSSWNLFVLATNSFQILFFTFSSWYFSYITVRRRCHLLLITLTSCWVFIAIGTTKKEATKRILSSFFMKCTQQPETIYFPAISIIHGLLQNDF